jgi:hypothetical protein
MIKTLIGNALFSLARVFLVFRERRWSGGAESVPRKIAGKSMVSVTRCSPVRTNMDTGDLMNGQS